MEQATLSRPALEPSGPAPPGPRVPAALQAVRYAREPVEYLNELARRHGEIFTVTLPYFGDLHYVAAPALVKELFTGSPEVLHAGEANATVLEPALGPNSVLTLDEGAHMRQRKLLLPPFHGERIDAYGELIREITLREMESWPVGERFPLRPHTQRITLAVIMRAVFGVEDEARLTRFSRLIDEFSARTNLFATFPPLRRRLGGISPWDRFVRAREELDSFIYEEIAIRRSEAAASGEHDDVLSLLLEARHDDGSPMSDQELRDELVTILGAGHETTATALAWAMERLLRSPEAMARLRDSLAGGDEYLTAAVRETLRSRPVVIDVGRRLTAPTRIGGYELPAGSYLLAAIAALHNREDLYPEPERFRPERFLDGGPDAYSWIPFGGGVRRCIGAAFAEYEMRIVLRAILERAELRAPDPRPEAAKLRNITLAPEHGARVVLDRPPR